MRKDSAVPRLLAAATAFAVWCGAGVLPVVHEWRVGTAEAAFHAGVQAPDRPTVLPPGSGHRHHDEDGCALCPLFSAARGSAPAGVGAPAPAPDASSLALLPLVAPKAAGRLLSSPRGPPQEFLPS